MSTPAEERPEFGALLEETFKGEKPPAEGSPAAPAPPAAEPPPQGAAEDKPPANPYETLAKKVAGEEDPPPEAKPAEDPAQDEELEKEYPTPKDFTEKAGQAWKRVRGELHSAKKKVQELEQQLAQAKTAPPSKANTEDIEALRARLAEAEEVLASVNVEATSEFQNTVTRPKKQILDTVDALTKKYGVDSDDLRSAMSDETKVDELGDLVASFAERDRLRVYAMAEELQRIDARASLLKNNSKQTLEALEASRREQMEREAEQARITRGKVADTVWNTVRQNPLLQEIEGAEEWNQGIREIDSFVRGLDFTRLTPREVYAMAYQGAVYPRALDAINHYTKENRALRAQLAKLTGGQPPAGPSTPPEVSGAPRPVDKKVDFEDAVDAALRSLG